MGDSEDITLATRREIYQRISEEPGIHFNCLVRNLDYAEGTLQYHLRRLEEMGFLERSEGSNYTRYYPAGEYEKQDKEIINTLRRKCSREIVAHLYESNPLTTSDLADRLDKDPSTISWHLSKLEEADVVRKERDGRYVYYHLADREQIGRLFVTHKRSRTDNFIEGFCELWEIQS